MKNTIKSLAFVLLGPVLLCSVFRVDVINSNVNRGPAVEQKTKVVTVKSAVKEYLLAVNNIK